MSEPSVHYFHINDSRTVDAVKDRSDTWQPFVELSTYERLREENELLKSQYKDCDMGSYNLMREIRDLRAQLVQAKHDRETSNYKLKCEALGIKAQLAECEKTLVEIKNMNAIDVYTVGSYAKELARQTLTKLEEKK